MCFPYFMILDDVNLFGFYFSRFQRAKPIIIDPGLYMNKKTDVFWITQRRSVPTAFKLFTGIISFFALILFS